ncbi:hypothetical protein OC842_003398 [Tilletia horrida]|uniref:Uncharacterized protein n=1 Tax=Tilletia horrida TaxID=155126 RepID=A0AAN6JK72_9BASI|nr:hypothetical protein OC842_003398 [Tilletia horrida]
MCKQVVESILCRRCKSNSTGQHFSTHKCPAAFLPWSQPCVPQVVHKNVSGMHKCGACKGTSWLGRVSSGVDRVMHPRGSGNAFGPDLYSLPLSRQY